ncbi:MAG: DUF1080 domain-containing protein [Planctomycetaceae bacterium]
MIQNFLMHTLLLMIILMSSRAEADVIDEYTAAGKQGLSVEQLQEHGFSPLFIGESLDAWKIEPGHVGHWDATEGIIEYDGKAEQPKHFDKSLWTRQEYGDCLFYVEWKFPEAPTLKPHPIVLWNGDFLLDENGARITRPRLDAGDSGILFRGILNCQANIWCQELGSGEINGYRVNRKLDQKLRRSCIPVINADNPLGEWNHFLISLKEDRMQVNLNGQRVLDSEPLPDLPPRGPIGLQHHGDRIQFRNIWVKELD